MKRILPSLIIAISFALSAAAQDSSKVLTLSEVVVTGQFSPQSIKNSVYQLRVISRERIRLSGALNVQQLMRLQPGIRFTNDLALGTSNISINGNSARTVKILLDGMPIPDYYDDRVVLNQIDINTIERIEIVEGPMSTIYGSDAMAGVINIITKKVSGRKWDISAKLQEETAGKEYYPFSYQGVHQQSFNAAVKTGSLRFQLGGAHNEQDGFEGDRFGRDKSWLPKEQWLGHALVGMQKKNLDLYYRIDGLREGIIDRNGIYIDPDPVSLTVDATDQRFRTFRVTHQLQGSFRLNGAWNFNGALSYTDYERSTRTVHRDFLHKTDSLSKGAGQQDTSYLNQLSARFTAQYQLSKKWHFQSGFDFMQENAEGARISGTPVIADLGLFLTSEWKPLAALSVRPSVRFTHNTVYKAPPAIPSLNIKYSISSKTDLRAAYGMGFRAPALRELFFIFVDANHNIYGNSGLKSEKSNNFSASVTQRFLETKRKSFNSTLGAFYNNFKDQITLAVDANDPTRYSYFNVARTRNIGFTLDNQFMLNSLRIGLGGNYIALAPSFEARDVKFDDRDYLWTPEITGSVNYSFRKIKTDVALFYKYTGVKPVFTYQSSNVSPGYYVTETAGYHLADFNVSKSLFKFFTVNAGVRNIFDVTRVNNTAVNSGVHTANGNRPIDYGRSYFLGINFQLSK